MYVVLTMSGLMRKPDEMVVDLRPIVPHRSHGVCGIPTVVGQEGADTILERNVGVKKLLPRREGLTIVYPP
jgi:hypothetical protein